MCASNHFKEFHKKNKAATLGGERWWQGGQEDFWELPCMWVASTGLELPWVQGLLPVVPLGFASRGRELKAGHTAGKIKEWAGFHREICNETSHACVDTPRRTRGLCPLLLRLGRRLPIIVDRADDAQTGSLGREVPLSPKSQQLACRGSPQLFLGVRPRVPGFVCGVTCSQHCFVLHKETGAEMPHQVSQLLRYMCVPAHFPWW